MRIRNLLSAAFLILGLSPSFADEVDPLTLRPATNSGGQSVFTRADGAALELDLCKYFKSNKRKFVLVSPAIDAKTLAGKVAYLTLRGSGVRANLEIYFEGQTSRKRHFYNKKKVRLSQHSHAFTHACEIPSDISSLHLRIDVMRCGDAPVRIERLEWGEDDGSHMQDPMPALGRPELMFHVTFDGGANAAVAKGEKTFRKLSGVTFEPGVRGDAARFSSCAKSRLAYAAARNFDQRQGSVSLWIKSDGLCDRNRFLFSVGHSFWSKCRKGSGAIYLWLWNGNLRCDRSDDDDEKVLRDDWNADDGRWHHIVYSWRDGELGLYVDGELATCGDDDFSPLRAGLRDYQPMSFSHFEESADFFIGSEAGGCEFDGLIDDVRIYSAPLDLKDVRKLYAEIAPPRPAEPVKAYVTEGDVLQPGPPPFATLTARNPIEGESAAVAGEIPDDDLELVDRVVFDRLPESPRVCAIGSLILKRLKGVSYVETDGKPGSRFAVRFDIATNAPLYVVDIDYPDDKMRTMDVIVQNAKHQTVLCSVVSRQVMSIQIRGAS